MAIITLGPEFVRDDNFVFTAQDFSDWEVVIAINNPPVPASPNDYEEVVVCDGTGFNSWDCLVTLDHPNLSLTWLQNTSQFQINIGGVIRVLPDGHADQWIKTPQPTTVPEPSSVFLMGAALIGVALCQRLKNTMKRKLR